MAERINAHVEAMILVSGLAKAVGAAGARRGQCHQLTALKAGPFDDAARNLVPADHRLPQADRPEAAMVVVVQI